MRQRSDSASISHNLFITYLKENSKLNNRMMSTLLNIDLKNLEMHGPVTL